ncbi:hypothetical protein [Microvirga puerhi]|uniref:terminase small subunit-like protein n=1 Tax=Microvirga puerhi TaxID=2876078 RepID=UPI0034E1B4A4
MVKSENMSDRSTIYGAQASDADPEFWGQYARKKHRAYVHGVEITDNARNGLMTRYNSGRAIIGWKVYFDHIQHSKTGLDTHIWILAKRAPRK